MTDRACALTIQRLSVFSFPAAIGPKVPLVFTRFIADFVIHKGRQEEIADRRDGHSSNCGCSDRGLLGDFDGSVLRLLIGQSHRSWFDER